MFRLKRKSALFPNWNVPPPANIILVGMLLAEFGTSQVLPKMRETIQLMVYSSLSQNFTVPTMAAFHFKKKKKNTSSRWVPIKPSSSHFSQKCDPSFVSSYRDIHYIVWNHKISARILCAESNIQRFKHRMRRISKIYVECRIRAMLSDFMYFKYYV